MLETLGKTKKGLVGYGLLFLIFGAMVLKFQSQVPVFIYWIVGLLFVWKTIKSFLEKPSEHTFFTWKQVLVNLFLAFLVTVRVLVPLQTLPLLVALTLVAIGTAILFTCISLYKKDGTLSFFALTEGLLHMMLASIALFDVGLVTDLIYWVLGIYFILLGLFRLIDALVLKEDLGSAKSQNKTVSVLLSRILPVAFLTCKYSRPLAKTSRTKSRKPTLTLWIHKGKRARVDMSYGGVTYSYGPYDADKVSLLGMVGDGVLFKMPNKSYRQHVDTLGSVVGYGITLTNRQESLLKDNLKGLLAEIESFDLESDRQLESYLGKLTANHFMHTYKFNTMPMKRYSALSTSSTLLVDILLAGLLDDIIGNHGLLTPATYDYYLGQAYRGAQTKVIQKIVRNKE